MSTNALTLRGAQGLRILRLYHFYRLLLGVLLVLLTSSELDTTLLSPTHAPLFRGTCWAYLIVNIFFALDQQHSRSSLQIFALTLTDIALLSVLFYAGGGIHSGIGNLLLVTVVISNSFLRNNLGLLVAACASIALVYLTLHISLNTPLARSQLLQAATLGTLCFAAALFIQRLSRRLHSWESLAQQRAVDVADLEELNDLILQRIRNGILVVDSGYSVLLANQAAHNLLAQQPLTGNNLETVQPELVKRIEYWQSNASLRPASLQISNGPTLQPSFIALQRGGQWHTLILLEDISQIAQQAQQLKLVALGRLCAAIAHEIRNPLGAISHAAQLLQESKAIPGADLRLVQIVQDHSRRINLIIENILQLSRRRQAEPQLLNLELWLRSFVSELRSSTAPKQTVHLNICAPNLHTRMDPDQLMQVITNLVQNGLRYSARQHPEAQVWLRLLRDPHSELPVIEVMDDGPGIKAEELHHIFEPFYTTESKGTGLGLYISRELCESNQALLHYQPQQGEGACFRIIFAHPKKLGQTIDELPESPDY